ncbi:MAG TPA: sulfatase-like hydrolase/transferase [Pirellulales bacterium]|nr:sulfatase-like hydrolase/transferase [Pirellulales bacterium]
MTSAAVAAGLRTARHPSLERPRADVGSSPKTRQAGRDHRFWFAAGLSLAAVMVLAKLALLPFPVSTIGQFARWLLRLGIVVSPDLAFVAGLTVVCWLASLAWQKWPSWMASVWRGFCLTGFALCAVYAVASIPMYKVTKVPFTVRLLSFVGGPDVMASSIEEYLPPGIVLALIAAPMVVLVSPWAARRRPLRRGVASLGGKTAAALVLLAALNGVVCERYMRAEWTDPNRWERRIAQSPHWVLLASCWEEIAKDRPFTHSFSFDEIDDSDFRRPKKASPNVAQPLLPEAQRPKNVILIVLESTGAEYFRVGDSNARYATTPKLDALAAREGIVFDNIYSQAASSCKSLVALSNSVYPRPDWLLIVRDHPAFDVMSLPQVLKDRGYRTCYAHSGYWGWQKRDRFLKDRGVEQLIDASQHPGQEINSWGINDQTMLEDVLAWIDREPGRPFFAFAYTNETHHPYVAPQDHHDFGVDDGELARYLDSVRGADAKIGWLMAELKKRGLADSTLVAVTADHGESFGQHNQRTHSFGIYEQTVHVPLVLLHRSLSDLPRRSAAVGRHIDIAPTLLDLLGVDAPAEWQGKSLLRPRADDRAYFLSVGNEIVLGLRDDRYKYHYYVDTSREELFDVENDPGEEQNLATAEPDRAAAYRRRLGGWVTYQREFLAKHGVR